MKEPNSTQSAEWASPAPGLPPKGGEEQQNKQQQRGEGEFSTHIPLVGNYSGL